MIPDSRKGMQAIRLIFSNLDHFRRSFFLIFVVAMVSAGTTFYIPVLLAEFTKSELSSEEYIYLSIWIVALYFGALPLQWILRKFGEALGPRFGIYLKLKYFNRLETQSITQLSKYHSGYVLSLISNVSDGLGNLATEILWGLTYVIVNLSLFFYFTARESLSIATFNLLLMIFFVAISTLLAQKIVPIMSSMNVRRASLLERYADFAANVLTVKRLGIMNFAQHQLNLRSKDVYIGIQEFQNFHANRWLFLHALFGIAYIATIIFMLRQISHGTVSASILILFVASYAAVRGNVERLSENLKTVIEMEASIGNLQEILRDDDQRKQTPFPTVWSELTARDITFTYPNSERIISIPRFDLRRGEKICITGASGEGKTTFLNLLAGFYQPQSGSIEVDGISLQGQQSSSMLLVSQEAELFNLSLYENLCLGRTIEREEVLAALAEVDLLNWTKGLAQGLDTNIGERGLRISAGQRQRINLVRGTLLNRDIYLLDEPTSHLDRITEEKVIRYLESNLKTKTLVVATHREAIQRMCSKTLSFQNGVLA